MTRNAFCWQIDTLKLPSSLVDTIYRETSALRADLWKLSPWRTFSDILPDTLLSTDPALFLTTMRFLFIESRRSLRRDTQVLSVTPAFPRLSVITMTKSPPSD